MAGTVSLHGVHRCSLESFVGLTFYLKKRKSYDVRAMIGNPSTILII
jgi:hypothetical protein